MGQSPVLSGPPPQWYGPQKALWLQRERCMDGWEPLRHQWLRMRSGARSDDQAMDGKHRPAVA